MTHTACVRIFAARAIVPASCFYRFPLRKPLEQVTHQRCLSNVRVETTNTDDDWMEHESLTPPFALRRDVRRVNLQNSARILVKTVANFLRRCAFLFLNPYRKTLALALPLD